MKTYYVDDDEFCEYATTLPDPLPVGQSRTHTWYPEDPPPADHRRLLVIIGLAEAMDAAFITVMVIGGVPALAHDYLNMPTFAGLPLALALAGVWLVIAWRVINDIWPKESV